MSRRALTRLIRRSMSGDSEAFSELYKIFINTIYFNVNSTLIDKGEVEDAVQQVVLALHKGLPNLESPYAFHSYLYRITINVCNKYNKKEAKQRTSELTELEEATIADKGELPPERLERKELDKQVRLFIDRLPEKQRYALVLYYYYDMSYKKIAEIMDSSVTVVGSNINRAKKKLKEMLEDYENGLRGNAESEIRFRGISVDVLLASSLAASINNSLQPAAAEQIWGKCVELAPEIAVGALIAKVKIPALTAIIVGLLATGAVVAAAVFGIQYAGSHQSVFSGPAAVQTEFIPEYVSINFVNSDLGYPETNNPIRAEIVLSEGFPVEWRITDAAGTMLFAGTSTIIERNVFDSLPVGTYEVEWLVSNEEGNTGTAAREFSIM